MTPLLSRKFLQDIGIELDDATFAALSQHFDETLDERIREEIVSELTVEQADEFASMTGASDQEIYEWMLANVHDLPEIVSDEVDILLGEIAESADKL